MPYVANDFMQIGSEIIKNIGAGVPVLRHIKEKYSQRRIDLLEDVHRFFDVFRKIQYSCDEIVDFKGKSVLEIGCGNSLAIGLLFLALGAKKVFLVDRFKHLYWDEYDIAFHKKILKRIEEEKFPFALEASKSIIIKRRAINLDRDRIEYVLRDAAHLPIESASIDLVISNAVLEHVHNVKATISEMSRITREGGFGIHEIDLRDHFFKDKPLRLLKYPDWLWNLMTWNRPGYTNRLRISDFLNLFKSHGFLTKRLIHTKKYEGDIPISNIKANRRFTHYSYEQLEILAFQILLKKGNKNAI